jgi:hypothetical protein
VSRHQKTLAGAAFIVLIGGAAIAAPLLAYTISLAAFGLPHVISELRYVDERFSGRIGKHIGITLLLLLLGLVVVRVVGFSSDVWQGRQGLLELWLLAGLILVTVPVLLRTGFRNGFLAVAVLTLVAAGILFNPALALVLLAILHNVTPVGFIAEALEGASRRRAMWLCAGAFVAVPTLILSGLPAQGLQTMGLLHPEFSLLNAGPLVAHLGVFVPAPMLDRPGAPHFFSAAVYLQCLHYATVIHILPRLRSEQIAKESLIPWPRYGIFFFLITLVAGWLFVGFALSFGEARAFYGIFASVHAWIEIPLLLLAAGAASGALKPALAHT